MNGWMRDHRHLDMPALRAKLAALPPAALRELAATYANVPTRRVPLALLTDQIIASRFGWPRPAVGLTDGGAS